MISFRIEEDDSDNCLDVTLHSNNWEFVMSIGDQFPNSISLDKSQISNLIVGLVEILKEMDD